MTRASGRWPELGWFYGLRDARRVPVGMRHGYRARRGLYVLAPPPCGPPDGWRVKSAVEGDLAGLARELSPLPCVLVGAYVGAATALWLPPWVAGVASVGAWAAPVPSELVGALRALGAPARAELGDVWTVGDPVAFEAAVRARLGDPPRGRGAVWLPVW